MALDAYLRPRGTLMAKGESAPEFTLPDQDRKAWQLSTALKQGPVVLCFFPFAFTPVCASEMQCIQDEMAGWKAKGAQVVGVSCDSFASLKAWGEQMGLEVTLLSDIHRDVCKAFGLYWKEMNVASRGTIVIGQDGIVTWSEARPVLQAMDFNAVLAHV